MADLKHHWRPAVVAREKVDCQNSCYLIIMMMMTIMMTIYDDDDDDDDDDPATFLR